MDCRVGNRRRGGGVNENYKICWFEIEFQLGWKTTIFMYSLKMSMPAWDFTYDFNQFSFRVEE